MSKDKAILEENLFVKGSGFSMYPFVKDGDKVVVKKIPAKDLKIGDIILYKDDSKGQDVCHRLVKKIYSNNGFILFTRGDAGSLLSERVLENNFIGRVVGIIRNGRILNLRTRQQIIINWFIAKFYIILKTAFNFLREKDKTDEFRNRTQKI